MKQFFPATFAFIIFHFATAAQITCTGTTILSQTLLGGSKNDNEFDAQQTTDGGFILVGGSHSTNKDVTGNHGGEDFWIVKTDNTGNIEWENSYGGSSDDEAHSVALTSNGGYIVAGFSKSMDGNVTGHHKKKDFW